MATDLRDTALNPNMPMRRDQLAQMTATPRSPRLGFLADAMMALKEFANRVQVPAGVPLLGGEGVGSLLLGKAPEELVEMSYGNMPMRINPYAGQTASFVPEMKPGRGAQVADLLSLAPTPGGARAAAGLAGMADMGGVERALIGYHGTPHRFAAEEGAPLGRFRSEKIGTGEKAQVYGYGLYFAEAPEVASEYALKLSRPRVTFNGKTVDQLSGVSDDAIKVAKILDDQLYSVAFDERSKFIRDAGQKRWVEKVLPELGELGVKETGSLYTVDIPDEMIGKMLDWDKPLSQQPKSVRQFFEPLVAPIRKAEAQGSGPEWGDFAAPRDYDPLGSELMQLLGRSDQMSAASVLSGGTGGAASSAKLQAAGIPGIRYLDQGSRGAGDGTRNIVVFPGEESKVKILSRE